MIRYIFSIIAAFFIILSSWAQGGLPSRYNVSYLNMAAGMPNNFADDIFQTVVAAVAAAGVDLEAVGERLQVDGLKLFDDAFAALLALTA